MDAHRVKQTDLMYHVLASLHGEAEFRQFFEDMCTQKEIERMAGRVAGASMLLDGATYNTVIAATDISAATLSRVSRCTQYGSGGYRDLLKRYKDEHEKGGEDNAGN